MGYHNYTVIEAYCPFYAKYETVADSEGVKAHFHGIFKKDKVKSAKRTPPTPHLYTYELPSRIRPCDNSADLASDHNLHHLFIKRYIYIFLKKCNKSLKFETDSFKRYEWESTLGSNGLKLLITYSTRIRTTLLLALEYFPLLASLSRLVET